MSGERIEREREHIELHVSSVRMGNRGLAQHLTPRAR
jgi:hypothetical protein